MAVSKRTRFEVLRRDAYTCRYCRATDNPLTIDHVTPVALGGTDAPDNLVAACSDCNAGKGSTVPDAETVTEATDDARRWALAMQRAAEMDLIAARGHDGEVDWFKDDWLSLTGASLPRSWRESISTFLDHGLTRNHLESAVSICESKTVLIPPESLFRYFCGICWSKVRELRALADEIMAAQEANVDG